MHRRLRALSRRMFGDLDRIKETDEVFSWIIMVRQMGWLYCDDLPRIAELLEEYEVE